MKCAHLILPTIFSTCPHHRLHNLPVTSEDLFCPGLSAAPESSETLNRRKSDEKQNVVMGFIQTKYTSNLSSGPYN